MYLKNYTKIKKGNYISTTTGDYSTINELGGSDKITLKLDQMPDVYKRQDKYSPDHSSIGGSVRISDIYALIDNLSMVDYLHITKFYIVPWPKTRCV